MLSRWKKFYDFDAKGVIHVGANIGQEFKDYSLHPLDIALYIEPNPELIETLAANISSADNHVPVEALCSDQDDIEVTFNIANNKGLSSSILPLGNHQKLYPHIRYSKSLRMNTITLNTLIKRLGHSYERFQYLAIDAQGCDLNVLKGATMLFPHLRIIYCEVAERPLYEGGGSLAEITAFLDSFGFTMRYLLVGKNNCGNAAFLKVEKGSSFIP